MFNRKTVFNVVYAIAIIGLVSTCFGLLNELVNFIKMHKYNAHEASSGVYSFSDGQEKEFIKFYWVALILGVFTTVGFIVNLFFKKKKYRFIGVICAGVFAVAACVVVLVLSHSLFKSGIFVTKDYGPRLQPDEYIAITTFRSAAITFTCYAAVLIACDVIDLILGNKKSPKQNGEPAEE